MKISEVREVILDMYYCYNDTTSRANKQAIALKKVLDILEKLQKVAERRGIDI